MSLIGSHTVAPVGSAIVRPVLRVAGADSRFEQITDAVRPGVVREDTDAVVQALLNRQKQSVIRGRAAVIRLVDTRVKLPL